MPQNEAPKDIRKGPKAKPIHERNLSQQELTPILYPERTYSQSQRIRVLTFLESHQIPISPLGGHRKPTQTEASERYQIPQRTISHWVRRKKKIEEFGKRSTVRKMVEESSRYSGRVLWPELDSRLYRECIERREAGRSVRKGWFRMESQFQF